MMKKTKIPTKDRYVVEDGIYVLRQLNNQGEPMRTFKEREAICDAHLPNLQALLQARRQDRSYDR